MWAGGVGQMAISEETPFLPAAAEEISRAENGFLSVLRLLPLGGGGWQQGEDCGLFGKGVRAYAMREDLKQWVDNN